MKTKLSLACLLGALCVILSACNYDFPLTAKPTQKIEPRLLGDWLAADKENSREEVMHVRQFDDSTYAVAMDDDIYRIFHSDFAGTAFVSVQDLNPGNRKYLYYTWLLSADGTRLTLKSLNNKIVPDATKTPEEIQRLIQQNLKNQELLSEEIIFTRKKPRSY